MSDFSSHTHTGGVALCPLHHPKEQAGYLRSVEAWNAAVSREKDSRCRDCWLRSRQCYCGQFSDRCRALATRFGAGAAEQDATTDPPVSAGDEGVVLKNCEVLMYYHHDEIGRSCNTGHVLERLSPRCCSALVHGDEEQERALLDEIRREQDLNLPRTCILYPHPDAPTLTEWMASRPDGCGQVRIVALDGTYPQAVRQMKFLRRCLEGTPLRVSSDTDIESRVRNIRLGPRDCGAEAAEPPRYTLPLVRLDINVEDTAQRSDECNPSKKKGVTSALAGLTNQPAGDKICTLQAVIMALQNCGEDAELCDALSAELNDWIAYILKEQIKMGKSKMKVIRDLTEFEPIAAVSEYMDTRAEIGGARRAKGKVGDSAAASTENKCGSLLS